MKGPSEKGDQFALLEYMKGGQMVTHRCAPLPRIKLRHLQVVSMQLFRMVYDRKKGFQAEHL